MLWWGEGQAGAECGSHQGGDGMVMELAKGMRGNRAHRCEPIAILHASRSQRWGRSSSLGGRQRTRQGNVLEAKERICGSNTAELNETAIPGDCNLAV